MAKGTKKKNPLAGNPFASKGGKVLKRWADKIGAALDSVGDVLASEASVMDTIREAIGREGTHAKGKERAKAFRTAAKAVALDRIGTNRPDGMTDGACFQTGGKAGNGPAKLADAGHAESAKAARAFNRLTSYVSRVLAEYPDAPQGNGGKGGKGDGSDGSDDAPDVSDASVDAISERMRELATEGPEERMALVLAYGVGMRSVLANATDDDERAALRAAWLKVVDASGFAPVATE